MEIKLRLESEKDHNVTENVIRESFWNHDQPGCEEHFILHQLRLTASFIPDLSWVAEIGDQIVGSIVYSKGEVINYNSEKFEIIFLGPMGVLPEWRNHGIEEKLIDHTLKLAEELGFSVVATFGDLEFFSRFGFVNSNQYRIRAIDYKNSHPLLIKGFFPDKLEKISGRLTLNPVFDVDQPALAEFDANFPHKEKKVTHQLDEISMHHQEIKWKRYNRIGGFLMGALIALILFGIPESWLDDGLRLTIMLVVVLFVPRFLEKRLKRDLRLGRYWMAGTLAAGILFYILLHFI
jgi:predicted N-acetyltransferase YhbS